ncbi:SH3 type 3 domain protein [Pseudodesulfovibrio mercurii]|uniref:SH3 type 3 domain protein n=1 Tax=Pseudodesulfovibrio mercurii TaxID=641491 RepID=F0JHM5_9BACT|nr:SH3 domain-containing protein [Pseudodesulfovibrio mercurii]EGB14085.1 SH3 type 3 domain protein [Pseudodesulfovibrio mercurii]
MRRLSLTLVAALALVLAASSAFAFGRIMYTDRPLNLRDGRSPKAEWIGSLYAGQKVRVAHEKDGWVAIYEPAATDPSEAKAAGYSNAKFLTSTRDRYEPKPWGELVRSSTKLNIRSEPNVRGTKVRTLEAGEPVLIDFPEDDWTMVFSAEATIRSKMNGIGYCSTKYLEPVPAGERTAAPAPVAAAAPAPAPAAAPAAPVRAEAAPEQQSTAIQRVALTNEVNVYQSRTTNSPLVRTLRPGDVVQLGLLANGWYAVFKASDMIRSESSSLGYSLRSAMDANSREAGVVVAPVTPQAASVRAEAPAKPAEPARPTKVEAPELSAAAIKAEATKSEPRTAPEPAYEPRTAPESGKQQTLVIDRSAFQDVKRPDPTPDQTAHGYRYKLLEQSETREYGQVWIVLKVFLSTTKLPDRAALQDFAASLWKDHRRVTKNVLVAVYLPGMNVDDLAWGMVKFDYDGMTELWTRRATLFGTKFL